VFLAARSTNPEKHWPIDRWAAVIDWLVATRGCEIFFCGGPSDVAVHREIVSLLHPSVAGHIHDHSASVPLRRLGSLLMRMDLCMGVDSGLPHIAASHGVPVVVLFGPTDPRQWHPWKTTHKVVQSARVLPHGGRSMLDIGVEQVTAAAARLLDDKAGSARAPRPQAMHVHRMCDGAVA